MKAAFAVVVVVIITALLGCGDAQTNKTAASSSLEDAFAGLYASPDFESRITAIILTAELKKTPLADALKNLLKSASGNERIAVFYSLCRSGELPYCDSLIKSLPTDEKGIKELLDIESERKSFFASPALRILNYVGSLALYDDDALQKLELISRYADGWQADSIMEILNSIKESREKQGKS